MSLIYRTVAIFCIIVLNVIHLQDCTRRSKADIEKLTKELVPRFLPGPPEEILEVVWELGVKADLGNTVYYEWIKNDPNVSWTCDKDARYTIIMTNPENIDIPSLEYLRCFTTWLVINIPDCDISKGYVIFEYAVPRPHWSLGRHHYLLAVFKQPVRTIYVPIPTASISIPGSRVDLNLQEFVRNQSLGNPFAANYVNLNGTLDEHLNVESVEVEDMKGQTDQYGLSMS